VRDDGTPVAADELASAIVLEPGEHIVEVTAPGMKPARAAVNLAGGKRLELTVDLVAEKTVTPPSVSHARQNVGFVLLATGAAFAIGAGISLWVRNDRIDTIKSDCTGNTSPLVCPASMHDQIEGMRSTANALAPLAAVLGGVALATAGAGIVLVAMGPQKHVSAMLLPTSFALRGVF
jgi:hypothetical protein